MQNLNKLVSSENYLDSFHKIANILLNDFKLLIDNTEFEITEIEFYYKDKHKHNDIASHGDKLQKVSNKWYVHNTGRGGIDITFGNENAYGGILIRGIKEQKSGLYINGPLNVLKKIEEILLTKDRSELRNKLGKVETSLVRLEKKESTNKLIFQGPRIGLVQSDNKFLVHPYRFIVDITSKHKFAEKTNVYLYTLKLNPDLKDEILKSIGYKFDFASNLQSINSGSKRNIRMVEYINNIH